MTDLFEHAAARAARDASMAHVDGAALPEWKILMEQLVETVAGRMKRFTSDDVFDLLDTYPGAPTTHDLRAFGPIMMRAAKNGICRKADCAAVPSRRVSLHASPRTVWESLICREKAA
jgi:hypothetical protein